MENSQVQMPRDPKRLRILMMLHMPWDSNFGGPKAQMCLAEEFRRSGHEVEKFDYVDGYPPGNSRLGGLVGPRFATKAKSFIKANANRFDIIDCHQGNLPFTKAELGFRGLLVARSVGLYAFHREFLEFKEKRWPGQHTGNRVANSIRSWRAKREFPDFLRSFLNCDLINLCNQDERTYVDEILRLGNKTVVFPFGLSREEHLRFRSIRRSVTALRINPQIVFIGSWLPGKGSFDWAQIVGRVRAERPSVKFVFLGTGVSEHRVMSGLREQDRVAVRVVPKFDNQELPQLLCDSTIGAFPSYVEGFGFAVLEKLASGLPTVAYDIPGPRGMLRGIDRRLLVRCGDIKTFSSRLVDLISLPVDEYSNLSAKCVETASQFRWTRIARATLHAYLSALSQLKLGQTVNSRSFREYNLIRPSTCKIESVASQA